MSRRRKKLTKMKPKIKLTQDGLRGITFALLYNRLSSSDGFKAEYAHDLASEITRIAYLNEPKSLREICSKSNGAIFASQRIRFANLAGKFSYWEVLLKSLCHNLGIGIYESTVRRNAKSPSTKDIEPLKDEIVKMFPKLKFELGRISNLRNATVHGNFHQIRSTFLEGKPKAFKEAAKTNVIVSTLGGTEADPVNLSELKEIDEIKKHGLFAWFLDAANSSVIDGVAKELNDHIFILISFQGYWSLCFGEFESFRERLKNHGFNLTVAEIAKFAATHKKFDEDGDNFKSMFDSLGKITRK